MSKFQKLSQLNKDIELLENAGQIKAANILHKKFIKESQFMPMTMMPQMMMPQIMPMMPQMMVRPTMPVTQSPVRTPTIQAPTTQTPTTPVVNPKAVSAPTATTSTATTPVPASGQVNPSGIKPGTPPSNLTRSTNQQGTNPSTPPQSYGFYVDPRTGGKVFIGQDGNPINYVAPPGSTIGQDLKQINPGLPPGYVPPVSQITPPTETQKNVFDHYGGKLTKNSSEITDPRQLQEFYNRIYKKIKEELNAGRLTKEQYDELIKQIYSN